MKHNLKFGVVMRKALMESLTIEGEKEILRRKIDEHLKAAQELDEQIRLLERAENRVSEEEWNKITAALKEQVEREQNRLSDNPYDSIRIRETQLQYYAHQARMDRLELLKYIEEELVGGSVQLV